MGIQQRAAVYLCTWLAIASVASAGTVSLRWDPVLGAIGYRIYYGANSGQYSGSIDVGNSTEATLQDLNDCVDFYLSVKAYNFVGESPQFSPEVSGWARPRITSPAVTTLRQSDQLTLNVIGANFEPGASLTLGGDPIPNGADGQPLIRFDSVTVLSCNQIQALVTVEPGARGERAMEVGNYNVTLAVENPDTVIGAAPALLDVLLDENRMDINRSDSSTKDRVDGKDLVWLAFAFGSRDGEPEFNADADLNGDGVVDGGDLAYLAPGFGMCWTGSSWSAACP